MSRIPSLYLGATRPLDGGGESTSLRLPAHHLVTHGVIVGMTGSGKTGLVTVAIEEALGQGIPALIIDIKGDLPNLLLSFPTLDPVALEPWVAGTVQPGDERTRAELAQAVAEERKDSLASWDIGEPELRRYHEGHQVRLITPGSTAGEPLHVLSALERGHTRWHEDPEAARGALAAAVSLVLRLLGRDADPARSREHIVLSVLAERRFAAGEPADLGALLGDLERPPIAQVGALPLDRFLPKKERNALAAALNGLLASPTFATWREGATVDFGDWLAPKPGADGRVRTPAVIVSVAHLDDEERSLVLGVLLEELLTWVRSLPGSKKLRALVVFDEIYGFLPPHPANPPTKRPLVALMKQARAFGVGVLVGTQNPMDLDYRALSNAGVWCVGRLQTDADRTRVIDGLAPEDNDEKAILNATVQRLLPRWFVLRDIHSGGEQVLLQPRYAMSFLRGPMTRVELRRAVGERTQGENAGLAAISTHARRPPF